MRALLSPLLLAAIGLILPSVSVGMVATPSTQKVPIAATLAEQATSTISDTALPLRIDGVWYDLQGYANKHKGGRWLLDYARGRDVTAIFHAIHMHGERTALATLSTLPTLDVDLMALSSNMLQGTHVVSVDAALERPLPIIDSPLRRDLQAMLQRKFSTIDSMKATPEHWARTAVAAVLCANCWMGWYHGDALAVLLLPLAQWLLAAHTVHEATHGALSSDPRINYWAQFTAHPILFNVYVWIPQHILSHHQYTNDPQHDVDVHHFASARLAKEQGPYNTGELSVDDDGSTNEGWTFVWKGCLTTLGTCILQPLRTLTEKPTPNFDVNITPIPAAVGKQKLFLSMLPSFFVLLYPIGAGLAGTMTPPEATFAEIWPWVGMSIIWTAMTQTSHIQEDCQWDAEASNDCWTTQQIATALDYSVGNRILTWVTAGLNNQGLHHAMPTVSSAHFCDLYDEYEAICRKHGVTPRQTQDLGSACRQCLDYVFQLNAPEAAVAALKE